MSVIPLVRRALVSAILGAMYFWSRVRDEAANRAHRGRNRRFPAAAADGCFRGGARFLDRLHLQIASLRAVGNLLGMLAAGLCGGTNVAAGETPVPLFDGSAAAPGPEFLPASSAFKRAQWVRLNPAGLDALQNPSNPAPVRVLLNLFSNEQHIAVIDR